MPDKVYKVFLGKQTEAWYALSQEDQDTLLERVNEALDKAGGRRIVLCNSTWATEQWHFFGVEEFPSVDAAMLHSQLLDEIDLRRYVESTTTLGTEGLG